MRELGSLESAVMELLWAAEGPLRTRDVRERLRPRRSLAYTTVMTVLDRLYCKGWLRRRKEGRAYRYSPAVSRIEYAVGLMNEVLRVAEDRQATLMSFAELLPFEERRLLALAAQQNDLTWSMGCVTTAGAGRSSRSRS